MVGLFTPGPTCRRRHCSTTLQNLVSHDSWPILWMPVSASGGRPPPRDLLQSLFSKTETVSFERIPQMIEAVKAGEIDAFIADQPSADLALLNLGLRGDFARLEDELFQLALRTAVPKGKESLLREIEAGLDSISQEEMREILSRWLGYQAQYGIALMPQSEVRLSQTEPEWIGWHKSLRIAIDPNFAPYEFQEALFPLFRDSHGGNPRTRVAHNPAKPCPAPPDEP